MSTEITDQPRPVARLQPDSRPVVLVATWLVGLLALAAFVMGARGLAQVGAWAGLVGWQVWLVPVVLDAGLGVAALAAVVARARQEPARLARTLLVALTSLSVTGQFAHVLLPAAQITAQLVVGAVIAAAAPLTVLASTEVLLSLAIAPPVRRKTTKPRAVAGKATHAPPEPPAARRSAALVNVSTSMGLAAPAGRSGGARGGDATPTTVGPVTPEVVAEALRLRADDPTLGWGAVAEQLGVSKTSLQRRAKDAEPPALVNVAA